MLRNLLDSVSWFHLPMIATGIFVAMFLAVLLRVSQRARRNEYDRMASLPLDDGSQVGRVAGDDGKENENVR